MEAWRGGRLRRPKSRSTEPRNPTELADVVSLRRKKSPQPHHNGTSQLSNALANEHQDAPYFDSREPHYLGAQGAAPNNCFEKYYFPKTQELVSS
jgi:hypothetical protein